MTSSAITIEKINELMQDLWRDGKQKSSNPEVERFMVGSGIYLSENREALGRLREQYTRSGYVIAKTIKIIEGNINNSYFNKDKFLDERRQGAYKKKENLSFLIKRFWDSFQGAEEDDSFYIEAFMNHKDIVEACLKTLVKENMKHLVSSLSLKVQENDVKQYEFVKDNAYNPTFFGFFVGISEIICYQ